jgi:hypothetical protein
VKVDDAVDRVERVLELDPVAERSEVIAQVDVSGRLDTREDALPVRVAHDLLLVILRTDDVDGSRPASREETMLVEPVCPHQSRGLLFKRQRYR